MPRTPCAAGRSSLAASLLLLQSSPAAEVESRRFGTFTAIWHRHDPQARDSVFHKDTGLGQVRNKEKRSFARHSGSSASRSLISVSSLSLSPTLSVCLSIWPPEPLSQVRPVRQANRTPTTSAPRSARGPSHSLLLISRRPRRRYQQRVPPLWAPWDQAWPSFWGRDFFLVSLPLLICLI